MSWITATRDGVVLALHIQPGAKKTEIAGLHGDALKIRLAAPPVDGKANAALLAFLAKRLGVAKSRVELLSGETSRTKRVKVGADKAPALQGGRAKNALRAVADGDTPRQGAADDVAVAASLDRIRTQLGIDLV